MEQVQRAVKMREKLAVARALPLKFAQGLRLHGDEQEIILSGEMLFAVVSTCARAEKWI